MRIKFTGYIDVADLDVDQYDPEDPTGLTEKGYDELTGPESLLRFTALEDLSVELEEK